MATAQPRSKVIASDSAWEAAKAARRNLRHEDAVQESQALANQYREMWSDRLVTSPVDLIQILRTLAQKRIRFVLTGAHGIGAWTGRPRATHDIDILVKMGRNHARAVKAIKELYPDLEVRLLPGVTAFFLPGERESVIDVSYPHRGDLEETLNAAVWVVNKKAGLKYRVPSLEAALANKYGAMLAASRVMGKRQQDAVDFGWMVVHSTDEDQKPIDLQKLETLGERIWSGGGGQEILRLVAKVKAGKAINLDSLR